MASNEQLEKYLELARRAREENNTEDAKKYYDMARTENPDNTEARFFYPYYRLWESTKGAWYTAYIDFCNSAINIIKSLGKDDEALVPVIFEAVKTLPASASKVQADLVNAAPNGGKAQYSNQWKHCQRIGVEFLYKMGDALEKNFAGTNAAKYAVEAWKQGVTYHRQWPYCGADKTAVDKYFEKITKTEPDFVLPKKAGCITFVK